MWKEEFNFGKLRSAIADTFTNEQLMSSALQYANNFSGRYLLDNIAAGSVFILLKVQQNIYTMRYMDGWGITIKINTWSNLTGEKGWFKPFRYRNRRFRQFTASRFWMDLFLEENFIDHALPFLKLWQNQE